MLYQPKMQSEENPVARRVSCMLYRNQLGGGFPNHLHSFMEIIYVKEGSPIVTMGGKAFLCSGEELLFIPSLTTHSLHTVGANTESLILQISLNFFHQGNLAAPQIKLLSGALQNQADTAYSIRNDEELYQEFLLLEKISSRFPEDYEEEALGSEEEAWVIKTWRLQGIVHKIFALLLERKTIILGKEYYDAYEIGKMEKLLQDMVEAPERVVTMKHAAAQVSMEYHHFSRRFKELVGYGFSEYKNQLRLSRAEEFLLSSNLSVTEIAEALNFGTQSYFNRKFKEKNKVTPLEYRRQTTQKRTHNTQKNR